MRRAVTVILMLGAAAPTTFAATVRLSREARVAGDHVRLGEVARIGECPEGLKRVLAAVVVSDAPAPGRTVKVKLADVREQLFARGINLAEITLSGASEVAVTRKTAKKTPGRSGGLGDRVRKAVRAAAGEKLRKPGGEIDVSDVQFEAFGVPDAAEVTVQPVAEVTLPGEAAFKATASVDDGKTIQFDVTAQLDGAKHIVVAKRALSAGTVVRKSDVTVKTVAAASARGDAFDDTSDVVGERLARRVRSGGTITSGDIAKPVLVRRGETCRLTVRGRGFHVVSEARSRAKGALGEEIAMESPKTRKRFTAVVVGRREVEVRVTRRGE